MANPIVHWEMASKDAEKTRQFYSSLFGWAIDTNNPQNYGRVQTGGEGGINGGIAPTDDGNRLAAGVVLYVQAEDLAAILSKAESLGATVVLQPASVPGGPTIALFTDPEGRLVGLIKGM
jgi:predicted enzyme related to lactoylglutathione lyase